MPRQRNPKRDLAYQLWLDSGKKRKLTDIAAELQISKSQIYRWKKQDQWDDEQLPEIKEDAVKSGRPGDKNGVLINNNTEKFGFFRKYLPEETVSIIEEMPDNPLDILWGQIQIFYAAIIRAQNILYGKDKASQSEDIALCNGPPTAAEAKQALEKQNKFLQTQARAQKTLEGMISSYEDLLHKNWVLATEEQKVRVEKMKAETRKLSKESEISPDGDKAEVTVQFYMPDNNRNAKTKEHDKNGD